jgi:hypothetical protein
MTRMIRMVAVLVIAGGALGCGGNSSGRVLIKWQLQNQQTMQLTTCLDGETVVLTTPSGQVAPVDCTEGDTGLLSPPLPLGEVNLELTLVDSGGATVGVPQVLTNTMTSADTPTSVMVTFVLAEGTADFTWTIITLGGQPATCAPPPGTESVQVAEANVFQPVSFPCEGQTGATAMTASLALREGLHSVTLSLLQGTTLESMSPKIPVRVNAGVTSPPQAVVFTLPQ